MADNIEAGVAVTPCVDAENNIVNLVPMTVAGLITHPFRCAVSLRGQVDEWAKTCSNEWVLEWRGINIRTKPDGSLEDVEQPEISRSVSRVMGMIAKNLAKPGEDNRTRDVRPELKDLGPRRLLDLTDAEKARLLDSVTIPSTVCATYRAVFDAVLEFMRYTQEVQLMPVPYTAEELVKIVESNLDNDEKTLVERLALGALILRIWESVDRARSVVADWDRSLGRVPTMMREFKITRDEAEGIVYDLKRTPSWTYNVRSISAWAAITPAVKAKLERLAAERLDAEQKASLKEAVKDLPPAPMSEEVRRRGLITLPARDKSLMSAYKAYVEQIDIAIISAVTPDDFANMVKMADASTNYKLTEPIKDESPAVARYRKAQLAHVCNLSFAAIRGA